MNINTNSKRDAREMARALREFDGLDAIARFRAELGGWHVHVRQAA